MILFLLHLLLFADGYKILVYNPRFAYAHTKYMGKLSDVLVDAGFDVTVLLNDMDDRHLQNGTTKAKLIHVPACEASAKAIRKHTDHEFCKTIWSTSATNPLVMSSLKMVMAEVTVPQCRYLLSHDHILEQLRQEKFDIGVTELFENCGLGLFEALGIKSTVIGSSMSIMEGTSLSIGAPLFTSFTPGTFAPGTDSMSFWERLENLVHVLISWDFTNHSEQEEHKVFVEKYGKHFPSFKDLVTRAQLVFTNSVPYFDFPRLTLKKILDIGGITYEKPKQLSQEWLEVLKERPAILLSFGSVAKSIHMPEEYKIAILETIKRYPNVTFIWKHEEPIDKRLLEVDNIVTSNWVPQNDLLGHENVVGFITHGGANSVTEAAFQGKPMIVIPIFADQTRMANMVQKQGIGIFLRKEEMGKVNILTQTINILLYSEEMKIACKRFLQLQAAAALNPAKVFTDHVSLLAEFKTLKELQPKSAELSLFVLYGIDILLFISVIFVFIVFIVSLFLKRALSIILKFLFLKRKQD